MQKSIVALFILAALTLPFQNCGKLFGAKEGTDTGNALSSGNGQVAAVTGSEQLVGAICTDLTACHTGLDLSSCETAVGNLNGLPSGFGASQATMDDLANAETTGTVTGSFPDLNLCVSQLNAVSCASPEMQSAFQSGSYAGLPALISTLSSCSQVY